MTDVKIEIIGKYTWLLVFDLQGPYNHTQKYEKCKNVNRKSLQLELVKMFKKEEPNTKRSSYGISADPVIKSVKVSARNDLHFNGANELIELLEKTDDYDPLLIDSCQVAQNFQIPAGERKKVYQLHFNAPGMSYKMATLTEQHPPPLLDDILLTCSIQFEKKENVIGAQGLDILCKTLISIHPSSSNRVEWEKIRSGSFQVLTGLNTENFKDKMIMLLKVLSDIYPAQDNRQEWDTIRNTCAQAKTLSSSLQQLYVVLERLGDTHPVKHNKAEWAHIRGVCLTIRTQLANS